MPRDVFINVIRTAANTGHLRFAREASLAWLAAFPGDLPLNLLYAQILLKDGQPEQALSILERLCQTDPEYLEAYEARLEAENRLRNGGESQRKTTRQSPKLRQNNTLADVRAYVFALRNDSANHFAPTRNPIAEQHGFVPAWSYQVRQARFHLARDHAPGQSSLADLEDAETSLHSALAANELNVLIAVTHLRLVQAKQAPAQSVHHLAEYYRTRWPDCLQFNLLLAHALMEEGQPDKAVNLLHKVAARDVTGQVISRLWGDHHPYLALWPDQLAIDLEIAIPASVAAALGWNQLPETAPSAMSDWSFGRRLNHAGAKSASGQGTISNNPTPTHKTLPALPESLKSVQAELERVAERLNRPGLASSDGRFPVYVVMSTYGGLVAQYGAAVTSKIEKAMRRLVGAVQMRKDWHALLFFADRESFPGVKPARQDDPWSIKLALADLDTALGRKGEMIGAVLIVGGPEVVPFHHLPNPVDDADDDVPSDNPYSTRDENYFIPEWAVGRLPGGASHDPALILQSLERYATYHAEKSHPRRLPLWLELAPKRLVAWLTGILARKLQHRPRTSLGYTAAAWRRASAIVFRPIGEPKSLKVSPPLGASKPAPQETAARASSPLPPARLGYFNLHGLIDAVEWFGQSDPEELTVIASQKSTKDTPQTSQGQDYPVAVRPEDIQNSDQAPEVIFSEACYGGHILGRTVDESLALKFLEAGSHAVVASTCTAYGSIVMPLIAADYLGHAFWSSLRQGSPAGEALRRAKIALAREMHLRQGYLDGEDQKTLISFVLYGDPLALPMKLRFPPKSALRPLKPLRVKTICDRQHQEEASLAAPEEVVAHAKQIVRRYLPGMQDAEMSFSVEHQGCDGTGQCRRDEPLGEKAVKREKKQVLPNRRVVVLSKQVADHGRLHRHYARITLDEQNRLVKLVVSR